MIQLTKSLMFVTGTYNDNYARPYLSNITPTTMNAFAEATHGGRSITSTKIAGVAGGMLRPNAEPQGNIIIPNGWDTRRLTFMLECRADLGYGHTTKEIITGYTDHVGVSHGGFVDPNMRLYINNVVYVREETRNLSYGVGVTSAVNCSAQLLCPPGTVMDDHQSRNAITMRPEDVMAKLSQGSLNSLGEYGEVRDLRTSFVANNGMKLSRRNNAAAPEFLARSMGALVTAMNQNDSVSGTPETTYEAARDALHEPLVSQDQFLGRLMRETHFGTNNYVTYGEMCRLFPEFDSITHIGGVGNTYQTSVSGVQTAERGSTEYWHGANQETVIATTLSHAVPALMMELMLTQIRFVATNETLNGQWQVDINGYASFAEGIDMSPYIDAFVSRITNQTMRDLSMNNQIPISIAMTIDVTGDTFISVSYAGGYAVDFTTPSFCDNLMTPVIAANDMPLSVIASDIESLLYAPQMNVMTRAAVNDVYSPQYEQHNNGVILDAPTRYGV